ncbi:hypothetical protein [Jeotgalibacillus marinus]|uniref:Uncharacterized protein n=1 Tax=Jeotgalibacillus marinus TaxID=86667 RepID=A0ABV3Q2K7_9BACL
MVQAPKAEAALSAPTSIGRDAKVGVLYNVTYDLEELAAEAGRTKSAALIQQDRA